MTNVIFDTDIGTDVDDALALGVLLGSPEINLVGITTVYGDTVLRGQLAKRLARSAKADFAIPVAPGAEETLSTRPVWWPGHEGTLHRGLEDETIEPRNSGVEFLLGMVNGSEEPLDILAVGPLTNIALALRADADFASKVGTVYIMGGDFSQEERVAEHNFKCDAVAAKEVFESDLNIVVVGLDMTQRVALRAADVDAIEGAGELGKLLKGEIAQFWEFHGKPWNNPHDPIAALSLLEPELCTTEPVRITVHTEDNEGYLDWVPDSDSKVRVVTSIKDEDVRKAITNRIISAGTAAR